jgi:DNA-binding LacI/PurR family transcriptional regulator
MLVPDITNPHFFDTIRGAERRASAAGATLVLGDTEESGEIERTQIERLAGKVDGFVLAASRLTDREVVDLAAHHHLALVNRQVPGLPSAFIDNAEGSRQIIEHLASLGHRRLAKVVRPRGSAAGATGHALRSGHTC